MTRRKVELKTIGHQNSVTIQFNAENSLKKSGRISGNEWKKWKTKWKRVEEVEEVEQKLQAVLPPAGIFRSSSYSLSADSTEQYMKFSKKEI